MSEKQLLERQCVHFDAHGPLGMGTCKLTGYVFSGKLPIGPGVGRCAQFQKKVRNRRKVGGNDAR